MIKHLSGDYETVEYSDKRFVMLYDNVEYEDYPTHWHNAIEMIMPLQNPFTVLIGKEKYFLNERDLILIPPCELHTLVSQEGRRLIFQCDNSVLGEAVALDRLKSVINAPIVINADSGKELHALAQSVMMDVFENYYSDSEIADIKIYIRLLELFTAIREQQILENAKQLESAKDKYFEYNEKFNLVIKYIDKNYMHDIKLEQLAEIAGYSKFHFSRTFKKYHSMSYVQYINARRTKAAEALLLHPDMPITEVARRAGFSSLTTFNRIFKEIKQCTPSDFKKLYITTNTSDTTP